MAVCKAQIIKERKEFANDPVHMMQLRLANRELLSVTHDLPTQHLTGTQFLSGLCCPHMIERCYFGKQDFDKFTDNKVWVHYLGQNGQQLREHMDGWVDVQHGDVWTAAWEYPRYFIWVAL